MTIVDSKYRGTTDYHRVMRELMTAAEFRGTTTYQHLAVILGLPLQGSHMAKQLGQVLGEIAEDEVEAGRPMLSAACVSVEGKPGPGFYALARELKLFDGEGREAELAFWREHLEAVYDAWARPLPTG